MKKVLMLIAVILGTSVMVNARTESLNTAPAKEVTTSIHKTKAEKKAAKAEKKEAKEQKKAAAVTTKK
jgi:phosphoenolpyruvate-protein kinase (PTS system EI component)